MDLVLDLVKKEDDEVEERVDLGKK